VRRGREAEDEEEEEELFISSLFALDCAKVKRMKNHLYKLFRGMRWRI
jgi:hypothetical protein